MNRAFVLAMLLATLSPAMGHQPIMSLPSTSATPGEPATPPPPQEPGPTTQEVGGRVATVRLSVDPVEATVADRIRLTLEVEATAGCGVTWPELAALLPDLTIHRVEEGARTPVGNGRLRMTRRYSLEPFLPGDRVIPPLAIVIEPPDGTTGELLTAPVMVRIRSLLPDGQSAEPEPARSVLALVTPATRTGLIIGGIGALVLLAGLSVVTVAVRRRRPAEHAEPTIAERIGATRALLTRIRDGGDDGDAPAVLAILIRQIVEWRTGRPTSDLTTEEIGVLTAGDGVDAPLHRALRELDDARFSPGGTPEALVDRLLGEVDPIVEGLACGAAGGGEGAT